MLFFALGVFLFQGANAQLANVPTCSCSPLIYKWTLDFTRNCASTELSLGIGSITGLASIECDITMVNTTDPIDLVPVALTSYELIELSTDRLAPVKINSETDLYFQDGQHLALTSETAANPSLVSGGVKATIGAVNLAGHGIELSWLIRYTNVCEAKPFEVGDSIGWAVLNKDTVAARDHTCILPSASPSFIQSESPTRTANPSHLPSEIPSSISSVNPTRYRKNGKGGEYTPTDSKSQKALKKNNKGTEYSSKDSKSQKTTKNSEGSQYISKAGKSQKTPKKDSNGDYTSKGAKSQKDPTTDGKGSDYTAKSAKSQKAPKAIEKASDNAIINRKPTSSAKKDTITSSQKGSKANFVKSQKNSTAIDEALDNDRMTSTPTPTPKKYTTIGKKGSEAKSTKTQKAPKAAKDGSYGKKRRRLESNKDE
mmetsp:Transcript_3456/g.5101  ORF Transcript_3456/g.5101 Transcript_3456/m.5101 type:complete len:427 (-) Transcript_3456:143-1423(-)